MFYLKSDRLSARVWEPGEGTNNLERFDRSCYVDELTLDGKYQFLTGEPGELLPHRLTGGKGLVSEIKADELGVEAGKGGWFPKFGVGLLKNETGEKFSFRSPYEMKPFEVEVEKGKDWASFHVLPELCMGYALDEKRDLRLSGNTLTIVYHFKNVGEKSLSLGEYVHNFMTIEKKPLGPAYRLTAAVKGLEGYEPPRGGPAYGTAEGFGWRDYTNSSCMAHIQRENVDMSRPFFWKLTNGESPAWVMEETSFFPEKAPVWSIDHIVSCECYNAFTLAPGESIDYWRRWTFGD